MKQPIIVGIYKITSPSNRIYIGQSIDIYKRWHRCYMGDSCKAQTKLYNSFKKYGWKKHKFEIIHICDEYELNKLEKYYVDLFQTFNSKYGLNLRDGGGNTGKASEETKHLLGLQRKGKKWSDKSKQKWKKTMLINGTLSGRIPGTWKTPEETKRKQSQIKKGKPSGRKGMKFNDEWKEKIRKAHLGLKQSPETIAKRIIKIKGKKRTINQIQNMINRRLENGGWKYPNDFSQKIKDGMKTKGASEKISQKLSKIVLNTENGIYYSSVKDASETINISPHALRLRIHKNKTPFIYA